MIYQNIGGSSKQDVTYSVNRLYYKDTKYLLLCPKRLDACETEVKPGDKTSGFKRQLRRLR